MTETSITIVTPSFNQGKFIKRTIESVLSQGISDLEYLILDGKSNDETVSILKSYGDRVKWVSEKDAGQADAVNKGIARASGQIIGWLNSDDIYYPDALKKVLEVFRANPSVDVIYGDADHIDEYDNFLEPYYTEQWDYERLKDVCFICQPAVFFRKSVVEQFGLLDPELRYCMDYEYWLRVGRERPFFFLNEKLAGSRLYMDNKTLGSRRAVHEEIASMTKKRLGKVPVKWIYNLAHVIVEEAGYERDSADNNYQFVKKLAKVSCFLFLKHNYYVPIGELKNIFGWLYSAKKELSV